MSYPKYNREKFLNIQAGKAHDTRVLLEESEALIYEENKDIEMNMLREELVHQHKTENGNRDKLLQKQKYLNESNYFAFKKYVTKLAIDQAKNLYDFKAIKEEFDVEPEELIEQEVEEQLKVEIPLELQGVNGTIIPIKIETTPETADIVQTVISIMGQNNGADQAYMDTEQIEASAEEAVEQLPEDTPEMLVAHDKIADDTVNILSKDQQIISGIKAKMDEVELRVAGNEAEIAKLSELPYEEEVVTPKWAEGLEYDEETGLLFDPNTGEIYDPETGQIIKEELFRELKPSSIIEVLAYKKADKMIQEGFEYDRNKAIISGVNSLIVMKTFDHVLGRSLSYPELKNKLNIR